jgi:hypothetical protein
VGPPRPSIRAVDLSDEHPCLTQLSSQAGTIGAGALSADSVNPAVALQPLHQGAITHRRCGKLPIAESTPKVIDHGGMVTLSMRVHPPVTPTVVLVMLVMPYLFRSQRSGGHAAGRDRWTSQYGRLCAGSYKVTPPGRSRATTSSTRPTDRPKDSSTRQAYGESDPAQDVSHILTGLRHVRGWIPCILPAAGRIAIAICSTGGGVRGVTGPLGQLRVGACPGA